MIILKCFSALVALAFVASSLGLFYFWVVYVLEVSKQHTMTPVLSANVKKRGWMALKIFIVSSIIAFFVAVIGAAYLSANQ